MKRVIKETRTTYSVNPDYVGFALLLVLGIPAGVLLLVFVGAWLFGGAV